MEGKKQQRDLYAEVTRRVVEALDRGVRPWSCPWSRGAAGGGMLPRRHGGEPYRGVNVLLLWSAAMERGFTSRTWLTYRQAEALGGQVRKGERGTMVVYAGQFSPSKEGTEAAEGEAPARRSVAFLRSYTVFNTEQVDGLAAPAAPEAPGAVQPDADALALVARSGATVRHGGDRAFYAPGPDLVQMPEASRFRDAAAYFGTLAHELVHWTGHPDRLARQFGQRFGDQAYAMEELVAELGAAFVCAGSQLSPEPREDHAAYLAEWLAVLKHDKRAIFTAAAQAQRAADLLCGVEPVQVEAAP